MANENIIVTIDCNIDNTTNKASLPKYISRGEYFVPVLVPGLNIAQVINAPTHIDKTI